MNKQKLSIRYALGGAAKLLVTTVALLTVLGSAQALTPPTPPPTPKPVATPPKVIDPSKLVKTPPKVTKVPATKTAPKGSTPAPASKATPAPTAATAKASSAPKTIDPSKLVNQPKAPFRSKEAWEYHQDSPNGVPLTGFEAGPTAAPKAPPAQKTIDPSKLVNAPNAPAGAKRPGGLPSSAADGAVKKTTVGGTLAPQTSPTKKITTDLKIPKSVAPQSAQDAVAAEGQDAANNNPTKPPAGGPDAPLPNINRPGVGGTKEPSKEEQQASDTATGISTLQGNVTNGSNSLLKDSAASQLRDKVNTITDTKNANPGVDQGFKDKPGSVPIGAGTIGANPLKTDRSGGGPDNGGAPNGIGSQGTGAISDAPNPTGFKTVGIKMKRADVELVLDTSLGGDGPFDNLGQDIKVIVNPKTGESAVVTKNTTLNTETIIFQDHTLVRTKNGGKIAEFPTDPVIAAAAKKITDTVLPAKKGGTAPPPKTAGGGKTPEIPGDDATPAEKAKFLSEHPELARQIGQSKSGGGGNVDPARGDAADATAGGPKVSAPIDQKNNLLGNPGVAGGLQEHGAVNTNISPINDVNAIDRGPEGVESTQGIQQKEGDIFKDKGTQSIGDARRPVSSATAAPKATPAPAAAATATPR